EVQQAQNELAASSDNIASKWRLEAQTVGMTSRALEIYQQKLMGASQAQIVAMPNADKFLTTQEVNKKFSETHDEIQHQLAVLPRVGTALAESSEQAKVYALQQQIIKERNGELTESDQRYIAGLYAQADAITELTLKQKQEAEAVAGLRKENEEGAAAV